MESEAGLSASAWQGKARERASSRRAVHSAGAGGGWDGAGYGAVSVEGSECVNAIAPVQDEDRFTADHQPCICGHRSRSVGPGSAGNESVQSHIAAGAEVNFRFADYPGMI